MNTLRARMTETIHRNTADTLGKSLFATTDNMLDDAVLREAVRKIENPTVGTVDSLVGSVLFGSARFTAWLSDGRFRDAYVKAYRKMVAAKTANTRTRHEDTLVELLRDLLATHMFTGDHMNVLGSMMGQNFACQVDGSTYGKQSFWETVALMNHGTWKHVGVKRVPGWDFRLYTR